ncbi:hypothetical protein J6590_042671, partial [Homalodisca vitripennis]
NYRHEKIVHNELYRHPQVAERLVAVVGGGGNTSAGVGSRHEPYNYPGIGSGACGHASG